MNWYKSAFKLGLVIIISGLLGLDAFAISIDETAFDSTKPDELVPDTSDTNDAANINEVDNEEYGPINLLKTFKTPFTTILKNENSDADSGSGAIGLTPIGISNKIELSSLQARFHGPKLYLPSSMTLGKCEEFTVKGEPGSYAAIAMSEQNNGAKPICGHQLRLGADRKLVALGVIPENGILSLFIETPIQGDLVEGSLYFEGVVWSKPDFSDMQMMSPVLTAHDGAAENGVIVMGQVEGKKKRAVGFEVKEPISIKSVGGLSSGKP